MKTIFLMSTETTNCIYFGLIILSLSIMFYIFYLIKKDVIDVTKIDKITDLFKYTIVTISIATIAVVVTDTFKERDYDKADMLSFNQYLPYITDTTTIEKKINFCKFFCSVTPKSELKTGWESYLFFLKEQKQIVDDKKENDKETIATINTSAVPTLVLSKMQSATQDIQKTLDNVDATNEDSFLVVLGADDSLKETKEVIEFAKEKLAKDAIVYKKGKWYITTLPKITQYKEAQQLAKDVIEKSGNKKLAYVISTKSWCKAAEKSPTENCMICN